MFGIDKMQALLVSINLPQIFTIYDIYVLRMLPKDFQENILGEVNLGKNHCSEHSVCNLIKRRTLPPVFSGKIFKSGLLWMAASE